jgi:hypothetical protein
MKNSSKLAAAIALFLVLTIAVTIVALPTANAHTPAWEIPTYAYIHAAPNPVGVSQTVSVYIWLTNYYYGAQVNNDLKFHNYKLTITAPNDEVTTQNFPVVTDPTSNQHTTFIPDQVGEYTLEFTYPGETYVGPAPYTDDVFLPSNATTTLTVQEEQLPPPIGGYPLPTEYWTRPIYGENTNWWEISSNWLGTQWYPYAGDIGPGQNYYPGDAVGPLTNHVMWTKPLQSGGVVGGNQMDIQGQTYFDGSAYMNRYINPIIMDGKLFYTEPLAFNGAPNAMTGNNRYGPTVCVDLRTGKVIWSSTDVAAITMGLLMDVQTPNEHGVCPPLLISNNAFTGWQVYDGDTGVLLCSVTNVPQPPGFGPSNCAPVIGPDGLYIYYVFANAGNDTNPDWRLGEWNSSRVFMPAGAMSPTLMGTIDGGISDPSDPNCRYDWNVSIPWLNTMTTPINTIFNTPWTPTVIAGTPLTVVGANFGDGILCINGTPPSNGENDLYTYVSSDPYTYFFINLNASKGTIGSVRWWKTLQPPANNYTVIPSVIDWETRVFLESYKENVQWVAYNLESGEHLWTAEPQTAMDYYGGTGPGTLSGQIAYGKLYSSGMGGILYCYDDKTGELLWTYGNGGEGNSTNSGFNWPYGNIPTFINAVGNGVLYTVTTAHTWTTPVYKGGLARAINATDGSEIWTISSVTAEFIATSYAIADGYATWFNGYDNQIYVVGRGPSATTVSAPDTATAFGTPVVIKGTVIDICTGATQDEQAARFPKGVPAISDASMKDWMGYVYQQKPRPRDAVGVNVTISVLDSNNNYRDIGTVTSNADGFFSLEWMPDIPGKFTVYATFTGSEGYWPSHDVTAFTVMEPPEVTPPPTAPPAPMTDTYVAGFGIGIIIAIIIGFAALILMLRKR